MSEILAKGEGKQRKGKIERKGLKGRKGTNGNQGKREGGHKRRGIKAGKRRQQSEG